MGFTHENRNLIIWLPSGKQTLLTDITNRQYNDFTTELYNYKDYNGLKIEDIKLHEVMEILIKLAKGWER
jgi:hypothetical protein